MKASFDQLHLSKQKKAASKEAAKVWKSMKAIQKSESVFITQLLKLIGTQNTTSQVASFFIKVT